MAQDISVKIGLDTSGFAAQLRNVAGLAESSAAQMEKALADVDVKIDTSAAQSQLQQLGNVADQQKSKFSGFAESFKSGLAFGGAAGLGAAAAGGLVAAVGKISSAFIDGNAELERYKTQFGTLLGSTEAAEQRLAELAKFGAETPFELPELAKAEKVLIGFGLQGQKAIDMTGKTAEGLRTVIGDIAAGVGVPFDELAVTFGKFSAGATGEAISRLQELGIVTKEQLKGVGIEFDKAGSLLSPLPEAMAAAVKIAEEKFGGGMAALSQTAEGQLSTLSDTVGQTLAATGKPIFEAFKGVVGQLNTFLGGSGFQSALASLGAAFGTAISFAVDVFSTFADILPIVVPLVGGLAIAMNAGAIATGVASAAQAVFNAVASANPIGLVVVGIVAAVAAYTALADAVSVTAEEQLDEAEAQKKVIEQQIKGNEERKKSVTNTLQLVDTFQQLANKTERSAAEEKKLQEVQRQLDAQYPDLIDQTKSFSDNLKGVEEIGRQATGTMQGLANQGAKLASQLKEQTRTIAFLKRNVAIEELSDVSSRGILDELYGDAKALFTGALRENLVLKKAFEALSKSATKLRNDLFQAKNVAEVDNAYSKFLETTNKLSGVFGALGQTDVILSVGEKAAAAVNLSRTALESYKDALDPIVNAPPPPPPPPPDPDAAKKAADAALKKAQAEEKAARNDIENKKASLKLLVDQGTLTKELADEQLKSFSAERLTTAIQKGRTLLQAIANEQGFTVSTKLTVIKDDVIQFLDGLNRDILGFAAGKGAPEIVITPVPPKAIDRTFRGRLATIIQPEAVGQDIGDSIASGVAEALGAFRVSIDLGPTAEQLAQVAEESNELRDSFKSGEISYQQAAADLDKIAQKGTEVVSVFQQIGTQLATTFQDVFGKQIGEQVNKGLENIKNGEDATKQLGNSFVLMGASIATAFAGAAAASEDSFGAMVVAALNALDAMIPYFVALIFGEFASLGPWALLGAAGVTATLYSLSALARSALAGYRDGGYTGDGSVNDVAGVVHKREFVANARATAQWRPILEAANKGLSPMQVFGAVEASNDAMMMTRAVAERIDAVAGEIRTMRREIASGVMERNVRVATDLNVGFDRYLYEQDRQRAAIRSLR